MLTHGAEHAHPHGGGHTLDAVAIVSLWNWRYRIADERQPHRNDLAVGALVLLAAIHELARGRSNAEIATTLFVGEATVKTHVSNVLSKLHLHDRVQAIIFAYEQALIIPGHPDA